MRILFGPGKKVVFPRKNEPTCYVKSFKKWTPNYTTFEDETPIFQIKVDPKVKEVENIPKKELVLREERCSNPYCNSMNVASFFLTRKKDKVMIKCLDCGVNRVI